MSKANNSKCLLLNADHTPLKIISWKRAIVWSIKHADNSNYGIEIIKYFDNRFIQGACDKKYPVPSVAKTIKYFNMHNKKISFSRHNLFIRDDYTCQYCGDIFAYSQLTMDHVIPKSRFRNDPRTDWINIVTSCRRCNAKKGNRTPKEANMPILTQPRKPNFSSKYLPMFRNLTIIEPDWDPYLRNFIDADQPSTIYSTT